MSEKETLPKLINTFLAHLKVQGKSSATILAYGADLKQLVKIASKNNKVLPKDLAFADIQAFSDWLTSQHYTDKSISRKLNAVKSFTRYLKEQTLITEDPAKGIPHPKYSSPPPRILSKLEYRALRDAAKDDKRIFAIIELLLQTGMRISEAANLELSDIKKDRPEIYIRPYESQPERTISLNLAAKRAVDTYLEVRPKTTSAKIFITKTGKPLIIRNIRSSIDRYFRKAEIAGATVKDLRSTFIVHHLKEGVDIATISAVVGHKRLSTTERYLAFAEREQPGKTTKLEEL